MHLLALLNREQNFLPMTVLLGGVRGAHKHVVEFALARGEFFLSPYQVEDGVRDRCRYLSS